MRVILSHHLAAALLAILAVAPSLLFSRAVKVELCGDSTMAKDGYTGQGSNTYIGWGEFLQEAMQRHGVSASVSNDAMGGRSARTFTTEGRFSQIAAKVSQGDFVVIAFGWNDDFKAERSDCKPTNGEQTICSGGVLTFQAYLTDAAKLMQSRGANVVIASQTPAQPFDASGKFVEHKPPPFVEWSRQVAASVGAIYIDHYNLVLQKWKTMDGRTVANQYYVRSVHFNPDGAKIVADVFAESFALIISGKASNGTDVSKSQASTDTTVTDPRSPYNTTQEHPPPQPSKKKKKPTSTWKAPPPGQPWP